MDITEILINKITNEMIDILIILLLTMLNVSKYKMVMYSFESLDLRLTYNGYNDSYKHDKGWH
jgi:hypothetical protein